MSNALRELLALFDIRVDSEQLKSANKEVDGFKSTLKAAGAAIATYFAVDQVREFIGSAIELGAVTDDISQRLGIGTEELQAFQYATVLTGGSIDDANSALRFFSKNIGDAAKGDQNASAAFAALKVNIRDANGAVGDTMDLLGGVADGFASLKTDGERTAMAMQLFGRGGAALIPLLKQGSAGVAQLQREFKKLGGALSEDTIKKLADADDAMDRAGFATKLLKSEFVGALAPALTTLVGWISTAVGWFRELTKHSYIVETAMWTLATVTGVLAVIWAALNIEILLVVLAIALLVLAVDDLYTWLEGGDSVIGRFIDALFGEGKSDELLKEVKDDYAAIKKEVLNAYDAVGELVDALSKLAGASNINVGGIAKFAFQALLFQVRMLAVELRTVAQLIEWAAEKATKLTRLPGALGEGLSGRGALGQVLGNAGITPFVGRSAVGGGTNVDNSQTSTQLKAEVTIHGAKDPQETGAAAGNAVTDALLSLRGAYTAFGAGGG